MHGEVVDSDTLFTTKLYYYYLQLSTYALLNNAILSHHSSLLFSLSLHKQRVCGAVYALLYLTDYL